MAKMSHMGELLTRAAPVSRYPGMLRTTGYFDDLYLVIVNLKWSDHGLPICESQTVTNLCRDASLQMALNHHAKFVFCKVFQDLVEYSM